MVVRYYNGTIMFINILKAFVFICTIFIFTSTNARESSERAVPSWYTARELSKKSASLRHNARESSKRPVPSWYVDKESKDRERRENRERRDREVREKELKEREIQERELSKKSASSQYYTRTPYKENYFTTFDFSVLEHSYFKIKAGLVQPSSLGGNTGLTAADPVYTAGFVVGGKFYEMVSADIEYMRRARDHPQYYTPGQSGDPTSWSYKSDTIMLNLAMDLMVTSRITPYARIGAGVSMIKPGTYTLVQVSNGSTITRYYPSQNNRTFTWQAGFGLNFRASSTFSTEIEYMFINRGSMETLPYYIRASNGKTKSDKAKKGYLLDHAVTIGLKVNF